MDKEIVYTVGNFTATIVYYKGEYKTTIDKVYALTPSEVIDYLVFISKVMNVIENLQKEIKS